MKAMLAILTLAVTLSRPLSAEMGLFTLPIAARVTERSKDGKGWLETGRLDAPFVSAAQQFRTCLNRDGWKFLHEIRLAGPTGRSLYAWQRGEYELTLMLWTTGVSCTGFSWGVADADKSIHSKPKGTGK